MGVEKGRREAITKGMRELLKMFTLLVVVIVSQVYTFDKIVLKYTL